MDYGGVKESKDRRAGGSVDVMVSDGTENDVYVY